MKDNLKKNRYRKILSIISHDRNNPTALKTIKARTGLTRRQITDCIRILREKHPICSTKIAPGGYWLGDEGDLKQYIKVLQREANTIFQTADNLQRLLDEGKW